MPATIYDASATCVRSDCAHHLHCGREPRNHTTLTVGLNPEISMALTLAVVGAFSVPGVSAKESSHFHLHGSMGVRRTSGILQRFSQILPRFTQIFPGFSTYRKFWGELTLPPPMPLMQQYSDC